jgi:nicotinamide phosphoribosyltransferase
MFKPISLFYTDGYKIGHRRMLAKGTTRLYGTWIPRSIKYAPKGVSKIVSFGQQLVVRWLHDEFQENFFNQPIEVAERFGKDMSMYLGMDYDATHFVELHKLAYLPIRVKSLPEGIETAPNIPHMTFINTVDGFAWLTLYLETIISSLSWKPSTSATIALQYKRNVIEWVMKTDPANAWLIPFLCHDFSARGLSPWDMLSSGLGHASSFLGSDTIICIPGARYFYNEPEDQVSVYSVNASEHSVSTTKIFTVGEQQMIADWLVDFPKGILSIVSDTFDLWKLITEYLPANKEAIMARDGKLVIRPDSGDPVDIICGLKSYDITEDYNKVNNTSLKLVDNNHSHVMKEMSDIISHKIHDENIKTFIYEGKTYSYGWEDDYYLTNGAKPQNKGVIELLWEIFGGTINEQGYKVLDPHIGAIYGDSITLDRQIQIYERLQAKGFASTNIVLGVGSFTYQMNTRDTLGFAAKGAWFEVEENGNKVGYDIYKDPVTDDGTKKSLKGLICVTEDHEVLTQCTPEQEAQGILQTIYEDGEFHNQTSLTEIRERLNKLVG